MHEPNLTYPLRVILLLQIGDGQKNVAVGSAIAVMAEDAGEINDADVEKVIKESEKEEPKPEAPKSSESGESSSKESEKKEEEKPAPKKEESSPKPSSSSKESSSSSSSGPASRDAIFASPIAKRMALDKGIPLSQIKGTGPNGRIIKTDVENYKPAASGAGASAPGSGAPAPGTKLPPGSPPAKDMSVPLSYTDIPASTMRKVIATRLSESKQNTPHYYLTAEINMDRVLKLRELFNKASAVAEKGSKDGVKAGVKLSVNDFVVKASAIALQDVPEANSAWMGDVIRQYVRRNASFFAVKH